MSLDDLRLWALRYKKEATLILESDLREILAFIDWVDERATIAEGQTPTTKENI